MGKSENMGLLLELFKKDNFVVYFHIISYTCLGYLLEAHNHRDDLHI